MNVKNVLSVETGLIFIYQYCIIQCLVNPLYTFTLSCHKIYMQDWISIDEAEIFLVYERTEDFQVLLAEYWFWVSHCRVNGRCYTMRHIQWLKNYWTFEFCFSLFSNKIIFNFQICPLYLKLLKTLMEKLNWKTKSKFMGFSVYFFAVLNVRKEYKKNIKLNNCKPGNED